MIDWHTHILPKMDDGSASVEESVAMLRLSYDTGVRTVILTPHFYPHKEYPEKFFKRRRKSFEMLTSFLQEYDANHQDKLLPWPELILGAEVSFFPELAGMGIENLKALTIGLGDYLMVELPFDYWGDAVYLALESLIYDRKIIPVIAHIDRYFHLIKDNSLLRDLVEEGMLIQLNTEALEGIFSRRKAIKWIDAGLIHILASDCHDIEKRPPDMDKGIARLKKSVPEKTINRLIYRKPL